MCRKPSTRCAAKKRSATMPTKNGEIMAASEVAPYAEPICSPVKPIFVIQVPSERLQQLQMKNWKKKRIESRMREEGFIAHLCKTDGPRGLGYFMHVRRALLKEAGDQKQPHGDENAAIGHI